MNFEGLNVNPASSRRSAALLLLALLALCLPRPALAQELYVRGQVDGLAVSRSLLFWKAGCGDDFTPVRSFVRSAPAAEAAPREPVTLFHPPACGPDRVASRNLAVDSTHIYWITGDRRLVRLRQDGTAAPQTVSAVPGRGEDSHLAIAGGWVVWTDGAAVHRVRLDGAPVLETVLRAGALRERPGKIAGRGAGYVVQAGERLYELTPLGGGARFVPTPIASAGAATAFAESGGTLYVGVPGGSGYSIVAIPREGAPRTLFTASGPSPRVRVRHIWIDGGTLYWHAADESGGPVMRMAATGGGASPLTRDIRISPDSPMVASSGYLFWTSNEGLIRLPLAASTVDSARGDVWIEGVEWVQVVQTPSNQVPMVGGKPTAIRVYVRSREDSNGRWANVTARLQVEGSARVHRAGPIIVSPSGSDRKSLTDSFLFTLLPEETRPGPRRMTATLSVPDFRTESDRGNNVRTFQVVFGPRLDLRLLAFPWRTVNSARCAARNPPFPPPADGAVTPWDDVRQLARSAANILPVSTVTMAPIAASRDTFDDSDCEAYLRAQNFLKVEIDRLFPDERVIAVSISPPSDNRAEQGWCCTPSVRGSTTLRVNNPQAPSIVLSHELIHHFYSGSHPPDVAFGYPRRPNDIVDPAPIGDIVGIDFAAGAPALVVGQDAAGNSLRNDLMNYRPPFWISLFTYCKALKGISRERLICPSGVEGGGP